MSGVPLRATVPAAMPAPPSTNETTTTCRDRIAPLVVRLLPAQRRLASELSTTKVTWPSTVEAARACSTICCAESWVIDAPPVGNRRLRRSSAGLLHGVEDVDVLEQGRGAAVAHRRHLPRLALAAVHRPAQHVGVRAADDRHRAPELRRRRLVGHVAELAGEPAALDPVE